MSATTSILDPRPRRMSAWLAGGLQSLCSMLLALALFGAAACSTLNERPVNGVLQANTERDIWATLLGTIQANEYLVGAAGIDERERTVVSAWKLDTQPFRGGPGTITRRSFRTRVHASYAPLRPGEIADVDADELPSQGVIGDLDSYRVTLRVEREVNESLRPMEPEYAKWTSAEDDEATARKLIFDLRLRLGGESFQLGDDPERRRVLDRVRGD